MKHSEVTQELLLEKFKDAIADFIPKPKTMFGGRIRETRLIVAEFEIGEHKYQCQLIVTNDEDDFI